MDLSQSMIEPWELAIREAVRGTLARCNHAGLVCVDAHRPGSPAAELSVSAER